MERTLKEGKECNSLFIKLFHYEHRICCCLVFCCSYNFHKQQLISIFHTLLPGLVDVHDSFYMWYHPELFYQFCYLELEKLRGKSLSVKDLRGIEELLQSQLATLSPLTPALFWPYNEEESFRQIQLLLREMHHPSDLTHISILFQEQTLSSLEFLIHYARPFSPSSIKEQLSQLPLSFEHLWRFHKDINLPFPIELGAFSLKIPSSFFDMRGQINLLYARRYITKYLESLLGPFRDYNGGLFEKQQDHFEHIRINLSNKIPLFDLFAEKIFYALQPIEARLALSITDAENLLTAIAELMQTQESFAIVQKQDNVIAIKNGKSLVMRLQEITTESTAHVHSAFGNAEYFCFLGPNITSKVHSLLDSNICQRKKARTLRLSFQEGAPPSLNPHLATADMRCRLLSKLLFEGLMRLNARGEPEPAGALDYSSSEDGLRYIFTLRPGFWSNGEKISSFDYVTSIQRALSDHVSHPEYLFILKNGRRYKEGRCSEQELGVRPLDSRKIEMVLENPDHFFLHKLAQPFFFPIFGSMREPKWFNGPYLIKLRSREGLVLERNPYFWQKPFFEQIEIKWHHDILSIYELFKAGKTDWIGDPLSVLSPRIIDCLQSEGRLKKLEVNRRFLLHFNTSLPYLRHPLIRHAFSKAIERQALCETIYPKSLPCTPSHIFNGSPRDLFLRGLQELSLSHTNYPPIKFLYSHQTGREKLALLLKERWEAELGIQVCPEKIEWNAFRNKLEKGEFEITATIHQILESSPIEFLERFEGGSSWNFSQWSHPDFRQALISAKMAQDPSTKKMLITKAERILNEELPCTPLLRCTHVYAHHPDLKNYFFEGEGCIDFSHAYMQKEIV